MGSIVPDPSRCFPRGLSYPLPPVRGSGDRTRWAAGPHQGGTVHDAVHALGAPLPRQDFSDMSQEEMQRTFAAVDAFNEELKTSGTWVFAGGLEPIDRPAPSSTRRGEAPVITDGPYSESKEYLGGFWIIEADDLDEALEMGPSRVRACRGRIEVRPFDRVSAPVVEPAVDAARRVEDLPRRVRSRGRRAGPPVRRHRPRRGRTRRRAGHRARAVATRRRTSQPGGLADPGRRQQGDRPDRGARRSATRSTPRLPCSTTTPLPSRPDRSTDDRLRLIFTCCHPALAPENRVALTLRLLGGLTVAEIAHAFLVPETTMAQRITRAKAKIKQAQDPLPRALGRRPRRAGSRRCSPCST